MHYSRFLFSLIDGNGFDVTAEKFIFICNRLENSFYWNRDRRVRRKTARDNGA